MTHRYKESMVKMLRKVISCISKLDEAFSNTDGWGVMTTMPLVYDYHTNTS